MDKEICRKTTYKMIYLIACAVNGKIPEAETVGRIDTEQLFHVCERQSLTAVTAYALEALEIMDNNFTQAKEKAIRKNILLDAERAKLLKRFESEHIWYMPMKGALLKDWYPKLGMRQMSDNDILCAPEYRKRIREIMPEMGFKLKEISKNVDEYFKNPVHNFEIHDSLFMEYGREKMFNYYENVKSRLIKDENNDYGYHFSNEDFYIYMIAHEYKHYKRSGTGVRSLLDVYIFMKKYGSSIDMDYIRTELEKIDIAEFERQNRELAMMVFQLKTLNPAEKELLDYYIFSGTYGTIENAGKNMIQQGLNSDGKSGKLKYIFERIFPPMDFIKTFYPFFYKYKFLIPVLWLIRPFKSFVKNRGKLKAEIKHLFRH